MTEARKRSQNLLLIRIYRYIMIDCTEKEVPLHMH